jgi:RNA polymerase sigma factor (sigma-70 family)
MKIKNITKANALAQEYGAIIKSQVRYYARKRTAMDTAFYDELYSETLLYVYAHIGSFDIDKAAIQTYVARLAEQGIKRFFQTLHREANTKKNLLEATVSAEYFSAPDKSLEQIENEAVIESFVEFLRKQKRYNEIRYINATTLYGYLTKQKAAEVLRVSESTVMRIISSIRMMAAEWTKTEKNRLAWY